MPAKRVLVVDDFEPWRRFVRSALKQQLDLPSIFEVSNGHDAVQRAQELQTDLILLDIGLPGLNGIDAARQIQSVAPKAEILCLSASDDADIVAEALRAGASGYVVKSDAQLELAAAIRAVMAGKQFMSERLRESVQGLGFEQSKSAD